MDKIEKLINKIQPEQVVEILKKKFVIEKMDKFFHVIEQSILSRSNTFNKHNSILLEFNTLVENEKYRLLLILTLSEEQKFDHQFQLEIDQIRENYNLNKIIFWSKHKLDVSILQSIKRINIDVVNIGATEINQVGYISNFYPMEEDSDYNYVITINKLTDLLIKRLKKLFHLVLSEIAATSYNSDYGKNKIATKATMNFEEEKLLELIDKVLATKSKTESAESKGKKKSTIAIDVGCGTGRHTFKLAKFFSTVHAFDFSPKMIDVAKEQKRQEKSHNVYFSVADLEYEELVNEKDFEGKADLVVASFGMGSFVEEISKSLRRFYTWLKPEGRLFISFYNSESILLKATPNWRDTSLSALIDVDNNTLQVQLTPEVIFKIFCKPFNDDIERDLRDIFEVENYYTYPTTMALLPNSLLENNWVKNLFTKVDNILAEEIISDDSEEENISKNGHYIIIIAKKKIIKKIEPETKQEEGLVEKPVKKSVKKSEESEAFINIKAFLDKNKAKYEILEHNLVLSLDDVIKQIGYFEKGMVKTVLLRLSRENKAKEFASIATLAEKKIDIIKVAAHLDIKRSNITFASQSDIISIGFPPGGFAPFDIGLSGKVRYFIDEDVFTGDTEWLYMGVGDNKKTLKIYKKDFQKLVSGFEKIKIL